MTLPYLTDDCILYILQSFQNNRSTLFNCLLVNRFWCKSTIPLLYANPFANITEKNLSIILTLIFCFNEEEILQLKNQLELNQIDNINLDEEYKPLFEYPKFLEKYDFFTVNSVINNSLESYCSVSHGKIYYSIPIFHKSILRQCRNLKQLDISSHVFDKHWFKNFNVQNFSSNLTKLDLLTLSFYLRGEGIENEFLNNISNLCLNLRKLIVKFPEIVREMIPDNLFSVTTFEIVCTIIQGQNRLKIFKLENCYSLLNNILLSLEFQKDSLVNIDFTNSNFKEVNFNSFNNLYNLKYLRFEKCKGLIPDQCEILKFASFKLKKLLFVSNTWNADVTSSMVKYLGASLQRLLIENPPIENISIYCLNLIFLKITIDDHFDSSVVPYFRNLRTKMLNFNVLFYDTNFFLSLANSIPINIKEISIYIYFRNPNKFLRIKEFLENCHNNFELINIGLNLDLKLLKVVLDYIERSNNSLKIFGMTKLDKKLKLEESKLLNIIKSKGVKIMEFDSIHSVYNVCKG
ncbi:uncharacterized protein OCT59_029415 [Rhizophagus irregularis]|uniref:F-box domain-containing protein n=2 Tax=Rhizophagus irregularis TaxID=588596 RepID=A0A015K657_RHIIW|nr:hypothetical protein GLOIN_2v1776262 [Rhizophagus irregularis DAOM 181602=DAOM 197198]EXX62964.1 hypothetical protein RirG_156780 [Rhizophagus irregularis DAOM 197198w]POG70018.1 hypothetical protein GLOIN_2v1776262 [Rhizophagus irregularis DAOM 181602=DAOM 197198]UZO09178.1 hypothetical protein OCT59_029415 [Rhizophagus irregularis]GBC49101.1 hypothetical protein GLOIN_2v1776262 [Rhizophagus irregularis DAOM 181602=DAOM 197198]|eukprot:XP_025176884.1 hypothetical protein GLOIN_2v1776262 [Rhizophagus irregularis DAOM 181602=DAOM 197198]